jgi:hypothetical protein
MIGVFAVEGLLMHPLSEGSTRCHLRHPRPALDPNTDAIGSCTDETPLTTTGPPVPFT